MRHARLAGVAEEQRAHRPARRRACRARSACPSSPRRGARFAHAARWNGQRAPQHDRRRELQREPLPVVELQRRDHRQRSTGSASTALTIRPAAQRRASGRARRPRRRPRRGAGQRRRRSPRPRPPPTSSLRVDGAGVEVDGRLLGGVVDRRLTPSSLFSLRSMRVAHEAQVMPVDRELEVGRVMPCSSSPPPAVNAAVWTAPPTWNAGTGGRARRWERRRRSRPARLAASGWTCR